ncbi:unnamed protein product, partial [Mesocestoides corti]
MELPKGEVETPEAEVHLGAPCVDASLPSAELDAGAGVDVDMKAPSGKVADDANLKMPSFEFKLPHLKFGKVKGPKATVETPDLEAHVEADTGGDVDVDVDMDADKVGGKHKLPGFKLKMPKPHLKLGGMGEAKVEVPEVTAELPEVCGEVKLPEGGIGVDDGVVPSVAVKMPSVKVEAPEVELHAQVPEVDVDVPSVHGELPGVEGKVDISMPKAQVDVDVSGGVKGELPSPKVAVEKDIELPSIHVKSPKFKFGKGGKAKVPECEVETPSMEVHGEVPDVEVGLPEGGVDIQAGSGMVATQKQLKSPHFEFKMPKWKVGGKGKVGKAEVDMPEVEAHLDAPGVDVEMPKAEVDVEGLSGKVGVEKEPKSLHFGFKAPKWKVGGKHGKLELPKGEVETPEAEVH